MSTPCIIVDNEQDWKPYFPVERLISSDDYLSGKSGKAEQSSMLINLCHSYKYLSPGYYVSLLAESQGLKVIPSVETISALQHKSLYALSSDELDEVLQKSLRRRASEEKAPKPKKKLHLPPGISEPQPALKDNEVQLAICFGQTLFEGLKDFARQLFETFPCPILVVQLIKEGNLWSVETIKPGSIRRLVSEEQDLFANSLDQFYRKIWRKPRSRKKSRYEMAILHNPEETLPPSSMRSLKTFIRIAKDLDIDAELVTKQAYSRIAEYDALFIRETTSVNNHTYRFSRKAEMEGLVVVDDPSSILRCTNKVYLAQLLQRHGIPTPETRIIHRDNFRVEDFPDVDNKPVVLKIPDGSFSRGVVCARSSKELKEHAARFFETSALLLTQEFMPTEYDWRIGIFDNRPIFACKYYMVKGHWQIVKHESNGKFRESTSEAFPIRAVPPAILKAAVKTAKLIGDGFYGLDVKDGPRGPAVIEINDNPNLEVGVEDQYYGEDLHYKFFEEFVRRIENLRRGLE